MVSRVKRDESNPQVLPVCDNVLTASVIPTVKTVFTVKTVDATGRTQHLVTFLMALRGFTHRVSSPLAFVRRWTK